MNPELAPALVVRAPSWSARSVPARPDRVRAEAHPGQELTPGIFACMRDEVKMSARVGLQRQGISDSVVQRKTHSVGGDAAFPTDKVREEYSSSMRNNCKLTTGR